eukprot:c10449_g1_i1.p1 GENE.c10449_g1_i1~~c10449_g1_i1.p1  ORF type:complete len:162 (-),score=66.09 c10449_g1_i1:98-583(-)
MDKDSSLPKTTINSLIKELSPTHIRCSNEARDLFHTSAIEFIKMITQECSDICEESHKATITPDHVILALQKLELDEYLEQVTDVYDEQKTNAHAKANKRSSKRKLESEIATEEAAAQQRKLFDTARTEYELAREQLSPALTPTLASSSSFAAPPQQVLEE